MLRFICFNSAWVKQKLYVGTKCFLLSYVALLTAEMERSIDTFHRPPFCTADERWCNDSLNYYAKEGKELGSNRNCKQLL